MHKVATQLLPIVFLFISSSALASCTPVSEQPSNSLPVSSDVSSASTQVVTSPAPLPFDFTARFEIFTNGTKRIFTDAMYHNQSAEVFIEKSDPQRINVKTAGTTWGDFFSTLPFSLSKECLVTGTKQTFCTTETKKLYFILNGEDTPNALDRIIAPDDVLRVEYGTQPSSANEL